MQNEGAQALHPRSCPLCGSGEKEPLRLGRDPWIIAECGSCSFVHLAHTPPQSSFADEFAWDVTSKKEKVRRKKKQPVFQWLDAKTRWRLHLFPRPETRNILEKIAPSGDILDVGCGDGVNATKLSDRFTPHGVEIAPKLAAKAHERFQERGGHCFEGDAVSAIDRINNNSLSGVMMNSYLEHEIHPKPVLRAVQKKMKPEARLIVKVPNFGSLNAKIMGQKWCGIRLPDHVNYFTWQCLIRTANDCGFNCRAPWFTNLPTNDNMWAILEKRSQ